MGHGLCYGKVQTRGQLGQKDWLYRLVISTETVLGDKRYGNITQHWGIPRFEHAHVPGFAARQETLKCKCHVMVHGEEVGPGTSHSHEPLRR